MIGRLEARAERLEGVARALQRLLLRGGQQRQQRLREAREVPLRDARLVAEGVAAGMVDRAEHLRRVVGVEERARPVVDGLAGDRHVVGVHHAVDEADEQPARDQVGLARDHRVEQRAVGIRRAGGSGIVPRDRVVGEQPHAPRCRRAPRSTRRCRRGYGSRRRASAPRRAARVSREHGLARGHGGERARGRHAERGHRLAHDVLAQHRPERGAPVAAAREAASARSP